MKYLISLSFVVGIMISLSGCENMEENKELQEKNVLEATPPIPPK